MSDASPSCVRPTVGKVVSGSKAHQTRPAIRAFDDDTGPYDGVMSADSSGARLSRADVVHVAKLARLALTDAEIDQYTADLAAVLEHAQDVAALDTAGVNQTAHPLPLANVYRVDEVRPSADRDEVLAMAPASENDRFRVPQILGDAP
jgi:aspartyl-tRNA(Asn)/glutamyl-tRNA(Gln) amidotransferase subunit C